MSEIDYFLSHWLRINVAKYPPFVVLMFALGFIFWIIVYREVLKNSRRYQLIEIPFIVAALDIGWEFGWAFLLQNDFGPLFRLGTLMWFILDVFVNYYLLKYNRKLVTNPWINRNFVQIYLFVLITGFLITYFMRVENEDDKIGLVAAYFINLMISGLYVYQLLTYPQYRNQGFSYRVAWFKFLGTGTISVGSFITFPHNHYLQAMCVAVFMMDILYIYLFKNYHSEPKMESPKVIS